MKSSHPFTNREIPILLGDYLNKNDSRVDMESSLKSNSIWLARSDFFEILVCAPGEK